MKKTISILLALLMVFTMIPSIAIGSSAEPTVIVPDDIEENRALPTSFSLKGDSHMPPVDNQGSIGCCVSESIAFLQYTNAVSRYLHKLNPSIDWDPYKGNTNVIFSPKWTYNISGAGGAYVYDILMHQGAAKYADCAFYKSSGGTFGYSSAYNAKSRSWDFQNGVMEKALEYRLKGYDYTEYSQIGGQMTTTTAGISLLKKIKQSIVDGNVVSVSGDAYNWYYSSKVQSGGTLGKSGQNVLTYSSTKVGSGGGHEVSLIGYDDEITATINGVTLKGAFLMQNSWGTSFCNDGYVWVMYDALNTTSPYPELNDDGRCATFGQYFFTDWENDVVIGYPDLMLTVDITATARESFNIVLTRTDDMGNTETYLAPMFEYGNKNIHPFDEYDNMNFNGVENGEACTRTFTLSYETLAELEAGKTVNDYIWGFRVDVEPGYSVTVGDAVLKNSALTVIRSKTIGDTVNAGDYDSASKIYGFTASDKNLVIVSAGNHCTATIDPSVYSPEVSDGSNYAFTLIPENGFTLDHATVIANGVTLKKSATGKYTAKNITDDTIIYVYGVMENVSGKNADITAYNGAGWEYFDKEYVLVVNVNNNDLDPEIYCDETLGLASYPYYFRITINGVSYYTQPSSIYPFSSSTLYRLNIGKSGYNAVKGTELRNVLIEVVCEDHVLYQSTIAQTTVGFTNSAGTAKTVTYRNNGDVVAIDCFPAGGKIVARKLVAPDGFTGKWSPELPLGMPNSNLTVDGSTVRTGYAVTFVVGENSYTGIYELGETPVFDGSTAIDSKQYVYTFRGWSPAIQPVSEDVTYVAQYDTALIKYTVTWVVAAGSFTEEYEYGITPTFKGNTAKASDRMYDYTFSGWNKSIRPVTKDITYTAEYTKTLRGHQMGDTNGDGMVTIKDVTDLLTKISSGSNTDKEFYDIDSDNVISIKDVTALLTIIATAN